jgi:4,4'-diaponeurosporenoate glycosyltransferase
MEIELVFDLIALILCVVLFFHHPRLEKEVNLDKNYKVSVIIPARNEEENIANLISDLNNQTFKPFEIIVVDDMSSDNTKNEVNKSGAKLISVKDKPKAWMGKTWACHLGSKEAKGELLLFIDADVRFEKNGLAKLMSTYIKKGQTVSVQPYHKMKKNYENFSLFFNLVEICANGVTPLIPSKKIGLFGPVILIDKKIYDQVDGHVGVSDKIVEDLSLGINLWKKEIPFSIMLGKKDDITFQMYKEGYKSLWQGWVKNFATGASETSIVLIALIVIWAGAGLSSMVHMSTALINSEWIYGGIFAFIYLAYGFFVYLEARRIGNYPWWIIFLHPLYTINFYLIFFVSLYKKIFKKKVIWKDRKIEEKD